MIQSMVYMALFSYAADIGQFQLLGKIVDLKFVFITMQNVSFFSTHVSHDFHSHGNNLISLISCL